MKLAGKTRTEVETALAGKSRAELVELVFSLVTFERLLTSREIAEASHVAKRDVIRAMRAGGFVDPIFGRGFFCRAGNSLRVSATAANAWRQTFFVPVASRDSIPGHKKSAAFPSILQSAEDERRPECWQTDVEGENARAKGRAVVRRLSPAYLGSE